MATKEQKEIANTIFEENPEVKELYMNPTGDFFTQKSMAEYSLPVKKGKRIGKIETLKLEVKKPTKPTE